MQELERYSSKEIEYIKEAIDLGLKGTMNVRFEEKFAEKFRVKYAIGVNSGTSTLHCCLAAMGIGPGDEVIVPPLTYASTSFAAMYLGAVPIYADIDPDTFNIDPKKVEEKITSKTKAILPVAIYGLPPDMKSIMKIAKSNDLFVLEDTAECYLGTQDGKLSGTFGDMGSFSLERSKHINTGDGGMIITDNEELAEKARKFSILGFATLKARRSDSKVNKDTLQDPAFERHLFASPNYCMPELCAAMGLAQLERLDEFVEKRITVGNLYEEVVQDCDWLISQKTPEGYTNTYWTYGMKIESNNISWHEFRKTYLNNGGDRFYGAFRLTYNEPALYGKKYPEHNIEYKEGLCPIAEEIQPKLMQLKTNYLDMDYAKDQARALEKTIQQLS